MNGFRLMALLALAGGLAPLAPAAAGELPPESYRFDAVYYAPRPNGLFHRQVAEFTPLGPIAGTFPVDIVPRPPFGPTHVAVDRSGPTYYGRVGGGVPARLNPLTGIHTPLPEIPISHPTGLTFDTARNRLVVSTLGSEGELLAYSPDSDRWSVLAGLDNQDIYSLTYSADEDVFYGLTGSALLRYDAEGRPAGRIRLATPLPTHNLWEYQLVATGDRLALLTAPLTDPLNPAGPKVQFSYLIDPGTGDMTAFGPVRVVPEPQAAALFVAAAVPILRRRRRRAAGRRAIG